MKISQLSVHNSLLINVISFFLIFAGIISLTNLTREAFPVINFDKVTVQTTYLGATPEEIEKLITIPLEEELGEVDDIDKIVSYSTEGVSLITIDINPDVKNSDKVVNDIQRAVDRTQDLPEDLEDQPLVTEHSTRQRPVVTVSLTGPVGEKELQDIARGLERQILDIPGVAKVNRGGWRDREFWVEVSPDKMVSLHVGLKEIIDAIHNQNINRPGGSVYKSGKEYLLRTVGEAENAKQVENFIVRSNPEGKSLRIRDVAEVKDTFEDVKVISKTNGYSAINLTIIKKESGDIIDIVDAVKKVSLKTEESLKEKKISISFFDDLSFFVKRRLNVLSNNGIFGMILVVLCLYAFLSFRIASAAAMGIPISLLSTFLIMYWSGISLNLLSMFGLIMVVGMVVDEEIVIAENAYRYLEEGLTPMEATIKGSEEVALSIIATVATTIAAFVPLFLMSGTMGKFVRNIPITVIITLGTSIVVALIFLPSHVYHMTQKIFEQAQKAGHKVYKEKQFFVKMLEGYQNLLKKSLKYRYRVLFGGLFLFVLCLVHAKYNMDFILFPNRGIEQFSVKLEAQEGFSLKSTEKLVLDIEKKIMDLPKSEVENFVTSIGTYSDIGRGGGLAERGSNLAQIEVFLTPADSRDRSAEDIIEFLRNEFKDNKDFKTLAFEKTKTGPVSGSPIQVEIRGNDFNVLKEISKPIYSHLKNYDGVVDLKDDLDRKIETLNITVDEAKAAQVNLTVSDISNAVNTAFEGWRASTIRKTEEEIDILVRLPVSSQNEYDHIQNLLIPNKNGSLIPLSSIAQIENQKRVRVIRHNNKHRVLTITASVEEKKTSAFRVNENLKEKFKNLTKDYPGYTVHYEGEQKDSEESLESLKNALILGVGLIVIILVAMFRSISMTLIIMTTIPLSVIGVVVSFAIHQLPMSFMAILGLVGLTGVVANSGIILIDFILKSRIEGFNNEESIIRSARLRFRPILLTTLTTIVGVIPAAYGLGGNDPFIQPMALALNYGLVYGAGLSLFYIPCLVAAYDDFRKKFSFFFKNQI